MVDSRAILLTPPGAGAIAVIRLAGPRVRPFLEACFSRGFPVPRRCVHGDLGDGERVLDDPVVVVEPDGDRADLNVHGGSWVVRSVLELAKREGFEVIDRAAAPLPAKSVDAAGGVEREVLQYLPLARTELALRVLLAQPTAWERVGEHDPAEVLRDESLLRLLHPPRVAIVGAPNVGKSTLANQLFGQERSITADLPGTTRDWVGELANVDGLAAMLVDTPGVRETTDPIERDAIHRAASEVRAADLVVLVLDVTQPLAGQRELVERYPDALRVLNKVDVPPVWDLDATGGLRVVARAGEGVDAVRAAVRAHFGCDAHDIARPRWWTPRQRAVLLARRAAEEEHESTPIDTNLHE